MFLVRLKGQELLKLASAFTSGSYEDKERESIRYLVTGRSDSANIPSWYLDFQNAGFEEELRKKFTNLQNMRPEALDNMMTEFISSTQRCKHILTL